MLLSSIIKNEEEIKEKESLNTLIESLGLTEEYVEEIGEDAKAVQAMFEALESTKMDDLFVLSGLMAESSMFEAEFNIKEGIGGKIKYLWHSALSKVFNKSYFNRLVVNFTKLKSVNTESISDSETSTTLDLATAKKVMDVFAPFADKEKVAKLKEISKKIDTMIPKKFKEIEDIMAAANSTTALFKKMQKNNAISTGTNLVSVPFALKMVSATSTAVATSCGVAIWLLMIPAFIFGIIGFVYSIQFWLRTLKIGGFKKMTGWENLETEVDKLQKAVNAVLGDQEFLNLNKEILSIYGFTGAVKTEKDLVKGYTSVYNKLDAILASKPTTLTKEQKVKVAEELKSVFGGMHISEIYDASKSVKPQMFFQNIISDMVSTLDKAIANTKDLEKESEIQTLKAQLVGTAAIGIKIKDVSDMVIKELEKF